METKTLYREYFPGYMGHIPFKNEVIGMTVGATNSHIKSNLTKEPEYEQKLVPMNQDSYSYYNKIYFNDQAAKDYKLEEDKVYSNRSKDAKTWISGNKFEIYPQHIPGYKAHIPGVKSSNIFGMSYAKTSAVAIKGDYCKKADLPSQERYTTISKKYYENPNKRSQDEEEKLIRSKSVKSQINLNQENSSGCYNKLSESFKQILNYDVKPTEELPYIVGYKGFRRGVKAGNYYGKNFKEVSINSINNLAIKN